MCIRDSASYNVGAQTPCNSIDGTYDQSVVLNFTYSAGAGDVIVNGQQFPVVNDQANITLTGLVADGAPVNMLITFTNEEACAFSVFDAWTAPGPCPLCHGARSLLGERL